MRIIIIGAIAAGTTAAAKARRLLEASNEIIMYEQGDVTSLGACGLPYFVGNYFDNENNMIARTPQQFEESGIQVRTKHRVTNLNATSQTITITNLTTGQSFNDHYDKLLISTGAQAIVPPFITDKANNIYFLRNLDDGRALRAAANNSTLKRAVVIGGGYIGLEVASSLQHLGKQVTLIELGSQLLGASFESEITDVLQKAMVEGGINLQLGTKVESLKLNNNQIDEVLTNKGSFPCDMVVASIGVKPATTWLSNSGLNFMPNGAIIVDSEGKTNLPNIYAAGDCASVWHAQLNKPVYLPLATVANKLGRVIGENLAGANNTFTTIAAAGLKVMGYEAVRVGLSEAEAQSLQVPVASVFIKDRDATNYYPGMEALFIKLIYRKDTKQILGGQLIGRRGAALRGHALSVAITAGLTTTQLGLLDFAYNPAFAPTWDALNVVGNVAK